MVISIDRAVDEANAAKTSSAASSSIPSRRDSWEGSCVTSDRKGKSRLTVLDHTFTRAQIGIFVGKAALVVR